MANSFTVVFKTEKQREAYKILCADLNRQDIKVRDYFCKLVVLKAKRIKGAK